jgi:hypothetical protein
MKDGRDGDWLWQEWTDEEYETFSEKPIDFVYYTVGHLDIGKPVVLRALASSLQRDGIADSLLDGFRLAESAEIQWGWAGFLEEEDHYQYSICDEDGETPYGDRVEEPIAITWVEFYKI